MNLVLNSDISFCSTPILFRSLSFFHSISVSQLHSTAVSEGHGVDMSCSELQATCGSDHIWHRHGGKEEKEHKEGEKRNTTAGDQWTGRKLGIFQQKRMQSVDLPGFVLADARKSCSKERVTNSSLMVTLPHSYISRKI